MKKKAEMGIGTLIIFIAMILVAAIAAGVLIQTATTLQNKALLTGERSKSQISTSISPMLVYAQDGSTNNNVTNFTIKIKLAPGSDPVRFSDLLIEFSLKNQSVDYKYVTNSSDDNTTYENGTMNSTHYYVKYLIEGDNFNWGYLQRGDVVAISLKTPRAVGEDETVTITLVPKIGNPTTIETATPDIITNNRVTIFP